MNRRTLARLAAFAVLLLGSVHSNAAERQKIQVQSTADGSQQPSYLILPDNYEADGEPRPLLVSLHSWSANLEQRNKELEDEANRLGWIYLFPNFRGRNDHPEACGSKLAQQDILDAAAFVEQKYRVDKTRIYLTGVSGGGHMTMLMVARYPKRWTAASAWVGISDLAAWHARHAKGKYGEMMRKCCGGAPGASDSVDAEYQARSPLTFLKNAAGARLDIAAGVHDGHKGSVPIRHSLLAFNELAKANDSKLVTDAEIEQLSRPNGRLDGPAGSRQPIDKVLGREIHLRRYAGRSRVTIFEGGHEGVAQATVDWLDRHRSSIDQ